MKLNCGQELIQRFPYVALYFGNVHGDHQLNMRSEIIPKPCRN